jgi:hypothetical protein
MSATVTRAQDLLIQLAGSGAQFHPGQLEAIQTIVDLRQRTLVVQRTGWGKSAVYFIATKLLRDFSWTIFTIRGGRLPSSGSHSGKRAAVLCFLSPWLRR